MSERLRLIELALEFVEGVAAHVRRRSAQAVAVENLAQPGRRHSEVVEGAEQLHVVVSDRGNAGDRPLEVPARVVAQAVELQPDPLQAPLRHRPRPAGNRTSELSHGGLRKSDTGEESATVHAVTWQTGGVSETAPPTASG